MQNAPLSSGSSAGSSSSPPGGSGGVVVEATRPRQTQRPSSPFRDVLANGTAILVRGAEVATSVAAGPAMAAAVRETGMAAAGAIAGSPPRAPGAMASAGLGAVAGAPSPSGAGNTSTVASNLVSPGSDQSDVATMQAMQRESQVFNLQLLGLQEDVQQENRRFSTVSNVLRAKHDTAKAAVSNIRA